MTWMCLVEFTVLTFESKPQMSTSRWPERAKKEIIKSIRMLSVHLGYVYKIFLELLTRLTWRHAQGEKLRCFGDARYCVERDNTGKWLLGGYGLWHWHGQNVENVSYFHLTFQIQSKLVYTGRKSQRTHQALPPPVSGLHGGILLAGAAQGRRPSITKSPCIESKRQRLSDKTHHHLIICCMTSQMICCDKHLPSSSFASLSWLNCIVFQHGSLLKRSSQISVGLDDVNTWLTVGRLTSLLIEERSVSTVHNFFFL